MSYDGTYYSASAFVPTIRARLQNLSFAANQFLQMDRLRLIAHVPDDIGYTLFMDTLMSLCVQMQLFMFRAIQLVDAYDTTHALVAHVGLSVHSPIRPRMGLSIMLALLQQFQLYTDTADLCIQTQAQMDIKIACVMTNPRLEPLATLLESMVDLYIDTDWDAALAHMTKQIENNVTLLKQQVTPLVM